MKFTIKGSVVRETFPLSSVLWEGLFFVMAWVVVVTFGARVWVPMVLIASQCVRGVIRDWMISLQKRYIRELEK